MYSFQRSRLISILWIACFVLVSQGHTQTPSTTKYDFESIDFDYPKSRVTSYSKLQILLNPLAITGLTDSEIETAVKDISRWKFLYLKKPLAVKEIRRLPSGLTLAVDLVTPLSSETPYYDPVPLSVKNGDLEVFYSDGVFDLTAVSKSKLPALNENVREPAF